MVKIEDLKRIDILRDMPSHILEIIAKEARVQILGKGTELFHAGHRNETFYMMTMGQVALKLDLTRDIDVTFENLQGGDAFGLLSLVQDAVSSYSAVCQEACEVLVLEAPRMFELFEQNREFAFYMIRGVAKQYQRLMHKRANMTINTIKTNPDLQSGMEEVGVLPRTYSPLHI